MIRCQIPIINTTRVLYTTLFLFTLLIIFHFVMYFIIQPSVNHRKIKANGNKLEEIGIMSEKKKHNKNEIKEMKDQSDLENEFIKGKEKEINGTISVISSNLSPSYQNHYSSIYEAKDHRVFKDRMKEEHNRQKNQYTRAPNLTFTENFIDSPLGVSLDDYYGRVSKTKQNNTNVIDTIDPSKVDIYLINMKKSKDRLKRFLNAYKKSDMRHAKYTWIEGVIGKDLDLKKLTSPKSYQKIIEAEKNGYRKHHYELTRGAVGCYISHMNIYREMNNRESDIALIFEDDVKIIRPNLMEEINNILPTIPSDWDILLLGCVCFVCGKFATYYDVNKYFLMHGYLLRKSSAKKILDLIEDDPIEQQIDAKFSDLAERGLLKIYCLRDKLAAQWDMGTNIQLPVKNIQGVNPFDSLF